MVDKKIALYLNKEDFDKFKELAEKQGSNMSVELRKFVKNYIKEEK